MKRMKRALSRSIPVFLITIVTLVMSVVVYNDMISKETEKCWDFLSVATRTMSEKVKNSFAGNLTLLEHVGDALVLKVTANERDEVLDYLTAVQENPGTIFSRIDVLLPDNTLVMQSGETVQYVGALPFEKLVEMGVHVSPRVTDLQTGKESIFCCVPVKANGEIEALLLGRVDCRSLPGQFPSYSYGGNAQVFLIDCADGSYLMDEWHPQLGNIHEMGSRQMLEGYENVDIWQEIADGKKGSVAFISKTNGRAIYMHYMPVEGFNWSLCVMVQEDQIFENVNDLRRTLLTIGMVAGVMLFLYLAWNLAISIRLAGREEEMSRMEVERLTNEAKSAFLSSISHDIRTPLNGIAGMLDVIERRKDVPEQIRGYLKKIDISAQYLMTLAEDVLDITEIESGKLKLNHTAFDLGRLAEELGVLVQPKALEAKVDFRIDITNVKHTHVIGSAVHLRRVLINLITNAIKYNKKNGEVMVAFEELREEHGCVRYRFTVRDTGIGMTKEFQQSMFDSFEQEHAGARTKHLGHGLGLTIVKKLVDKMEGAISVESEKDKGSTFVVTLPLQIDKAPKPDEGGIVVDSGTVDLTGTSILLAEDNDLNMEIAQILLQEVGASVTVAKNGRIAAETFAASDVYRFDVILMDIMMPEMDGLEATRTIRRMKRADAKTIPIIAMTASTFQEDVQRCMEAGMNEHVGKPLNMDELIVKISGYRDQARK